MDIYNWYIDFIDNSIDDFIILFILMAVTFRGSPKLLWLEHLLASRKPLPDKIRNFPVCNTSIESYQKSWQKVEYFITDTSNDNAAELRLDEADINNIHLKGHLIDKYHASINLVSMSFPILFPRYSPNIYFYFELQNNGILERKIEYPSPSSMDGIKTSTIEYSFEKMNGKPRIRRKNIEFNGRSLEKFYNGSYNFLGPISHNYQTLESSLLNSKFLFHLFGVTVSPKDVLSKYEHEDRYKKISNVISKITNIGIQEKELVIQNGNCPLKSIKYC